MKQLFWISIFLALNFGTTLAKTPTYLGINSGASFNKFPSGYKYSPGYLIFLNGNIILSKRSAISFGLGFNGFSDHFASYSDTSLNPYPGPNSICSCNYGESDISFNQILSPVKYQYSFITNSKWRLFISAGLEVSIVTKYSGTSTAFRTDSNGNIEYTNPARKIDNKEDFNDDNNRFRQSAGIGYSQKINKKFAFSFESNYTHSKDLNTIQVLVGLGMKI